MDQNLIFFFSPQKSNSFKNWHSTRTKKRTFYLYLTLAEIIPTQNFVEKTGMKLRNHGPPREQFFSRYNLDRSSLWKCRIHSFLFVMFLDSTEVFAFAQVNNNWIYLFNWFLNSIHRAFWICYGTSNSFCFSRMTHASCIME